MDVTVVIVAVVLVALAVVGIWYGLRWQRMRRLGGVSVALRWRPDSARAAWHLGMARYEGDEFAWYRVWSLRAKPDRVFEREALRIADRRDPSGTESYAVPSGATVLRFESDRLVPIEIAMAPSALTGFLSWLESSPPGRPISRSS